MTNPFTPRISRTTPSARPASATNSHPRRRRAVVLSGTIAAGILAVATLETMYWDRLFGGRQGPPQELAVGTSSGNDGAVESTTGVALAPNELAAAGIKVERVRRQPITHQHSLPGRVAYNGDRHVEITAPTGGILTGVLVKPGDRVFAGQVLAWVTSPEIGTARADVLQSKAHAELAATLATRARTVQENVAALTGALKLHPAFDVLSKQFAHELLGAFRKPLLASYAQMQLAESLLHSGDDLAKSGVLAGKLMLERQNAVRTARAAFEAACEQAEHDAEVQRFEAEATARDAGRRLEIARQRLAALLLDASATRSNGDTPAAEALGASDEKLNDLSRVAIRAPLAGTIESRTVSTSERIHVTDCMFTLADTSTLWINAAIRENDWAAIAVEAGQSLSVTVPALGHETFTATVEYVGREVSPETNAVPIVALIENTRGRLRPGLFVRVSVPVATKPEVLTVPVQSVLQHDGRSFVFVAEGENRFRRVDVQPGGTDNDRVEIIGGLHAGDQVVTHGAFILKSELLLQGEEDE